MASVKAPRQRRAQRAEATRRRVVEEAGRLFAAGGYQATTIEGVAQAADVSVETIYKRFGTKQALLRAALNLLIVDEPQPASFAGQFLALPALQAVRAEPDQAVQLGMLAAFSRATLERSASIHRMVRSAGAGDELAEFTTTSHTTRRRSQRALIDLLMINGPLRLDANAAAETYAALANPDLYLLLIDEHGWTPQGYQTWLADTLTRLLLPDPTQDHPARRGPTRRVRNTPAPRNSGAQTT
jgi:AcrR family transcriptional regulator